MGALHLHTGFIAGSQLLFVFMACVNMANQRCGLDNYFVCSPLPILLHLSIGITLLHGHLGIVRLVSSKTYFLICSTLAHGYCAGRAEGKHLLAGCKMRCGYLFVHWFGTSVRKYWSVRDCIHVATVIDIAMATIIIRITPPMAAPEVGFHPSSRIGAPPPYIMRERQDMRLRDG